MTITKSFNVMRSFISIITVVFTAIIVSVGCSKEEPIPKYSGGGLIKDGKVYIHRYAPKGMKYAPVSEEELPDPFTTPGMLKMINLCIIFEGEYEGHKQYWDHYIGSSHLNPEPFYPLFLADDGASFWEADYTKMTCIYIGEIYQLIMRFSTE